MKNNLSTPAQSESPLALLPVTQKPSDRRKQKANMGKSTVMEVRRSMRNDAAMLRRTAHALYAFGVFIVFGFCSCNGIVKDIYVASQYALFSVVDETGGTVVAVACCLIGLVLGCFTIFLGAILNSVSESLTADAKKLTKEG